MGIFIQASCRIQQFHQNGRRNRRLSTHRIRIFQIKVGPYSFGHKVNKLDII